MRGLWLKPFESGASPAPGPEKHLTRALVTLPPLSPMAHVVWLRHIGLGGDPTALGKAMYAFQTSRVPETVEPVERLRGISVLISREGSTNQGRIEPSKRRQIPDALIRYDGSDGPL